MASRIRPLYALCLAALLCGTGCGRNQDGASEALVGEALQANARQQADGSEGQSGDSRITLETEAGLYRAASGEDLPLPDTFPGDITLPDDARIVTATELGQTLTLGLHSPRSAARVFAEFRQAQGAAGWREAKVQDAASVRIVGFDKAGRHMEANVVDEPQGGTTLTLTVGPAAD